MPYRASRSSRTRRALPCFIRGMLSRNDLREGISLLRPTDGTWATGLPRFLNTVALFMSVFMSPQ